MLYRRKDSKVYWISFTVGGIRTRCSSGTENKQEAQELHDRMKSESWRQIGLKERPKHTWDEAGIRWLDEKGHKVSIDDDKIHLRFIQKFWRGKKLTEITKSEIDQLKEKKKKDEVSNATINRMLALVRSILRMVQKEGWIDVVPAITLLPEEKRRIRWLTEEEASRLLENLPEHQEVLARFALLTGLRQKNILDLEWSQVDMNRQVLWIHPDQAKSRKAIGVPLSTEALSLLRGQAGKHERRVFTYEGKPIGQVNTLAWRKALKRAGIADFRWHDLRHTWASWHVQNGTPLYVLKELGGWESFEMVQKYAHLAPEHLLPYVENRRISGGFVTNLSRSKTKAV